MRKQAHRQLSEHQEFIELCALYASGSLSDQQLKRLDEHLEGCVECSRVLHEFQEVESMGLSALAPDFARQPFADGTKSTTGRMTRKLLAQIENEILSRQLADGSGATHAPLSHRPVSRNGAGRFQEALRSARVLLPYAAAVLLTVSVSLYSYRLGAKRIANMSGGELGDAETKANPLQMQITELSKDREVLDAKLQEGARTISALTEKIKLQLNEIASLEEEKKKLAEAAQGAEEKRVASDSERDALNRRLSEAQASLGTMQKHLDLVREDQTAELMRSASLERRLDELSAGLKDRDQTIQQQRDLLAYDRDIRDLIGARDLYVAEVTDVGRHGEATKPFGRVFFTKGKSLIFYAYDLDRQPGLHRASAFQAWGRRGPDFAEALPLGILYLDTSSNKRWVLRFDDPKALAKIDAVFVTVEPKGGSQKPSGKPLLFAYLKVEPNHP